MFILNPHVVQLVLASLNGQINISHAHIITEGAFLLEQDDSLFLHLLNSLWEGFSVVGTSPNLLVFSDHMNIRIIRRGGSFMFVLRLEVEEVSAGFDSSDCKLDMYL